MDATPSYPGLVILAGIVSTTQNHLAKALERQGIGTLSHLQARLRGQSSPGSAPGRTSLTYGLGLILNHTTFIYHLLVAPLGGTTALYTSMYGAGLVALLAYSRTVLKEKNTRTEIFGALAILIGTITIGVEGVLHPAPAMSNINLVEVTWALLALLGGCLTLIVAGLRSGSPNLLGLAFGMAAGICGALDPFLKGVGQTAGGSRFLPQVAGGWIFLALSFFLGETAVVITQWGFIHGARASLLVPALDCAYVSLPVILQAILLPGYSLTILMTTALGLILLGVVLLRIHQV